MQIDLFDYIYFGGYAYLPNKRLPSKSQLEEINDEKWITKDSSVYTLNNSDWSIDFTYLADGTYLGDSITIISKNQPIKQFKKEIRLKYPNIDYEAFCDAEELVLCFKEAQVHFHNYGSETDYLLAKLYGKSCLLDANKKLIEKTLKRVDCNLRI